jgi:DNA-binding NarL/FixJ family response regulator
MTQTDASRLSLNPQPTSPGKLVQAQRILIVDAHPLVREGLRGIVQGQPDLVVCAEAGSARAARIALKTSQPDVLVTDLNIPDTHGLGFVKELRAHYPRLPILVLSSYDEHLFAERLIAVGANGYLMKESPGDDIIVALRRVLAGGIYVSRRLSDAIVQKLAAGAPRRAPDPIDRLSNRELQILHLIGKGLSTREIANLINVGVKTVESHRQRVKSRLNLQTGAQLVQYAVQWLAVAEAGDRAVTTI